jgi:hypothetical protein
MRTRAFIIALAFIGSTLGVAPFLDARTETCLFKNEKVEGQNKICSYACASGATTITVKKTARCPLTIDN